MGFDEEAKGTPLPSRPPPPPHGALVKPRRAHPNAWDPRLGDRPALEGSRDVRVGPSRVHGRGVFARHNLYPGRCLGIYRGLVVSRAQLSAAYDEDADGGNETTAAYALGVDEDTVVDGYDPERANWVSRINDARGTDKRPNVRFGSGGRVYVTRLVPRGAELLVDYGAVYWEGASFRNAPRRAYSRGPLDFCPTLLHPRHARSALRAEREAAAVGGAARATSPSGRRGGGTDGL